MKKLFLLITMLISILFVQNVSALETNINIENGIYVNQNGIEMTEENVDNLRNLGFTDNDIIHMRGNEFNENKDLKGHVEASTTKYYETTTIIPNGNYNYISNVLLTHSREITKEEYDSIDVQKLINEESAQGLTPGKTVTEYKEMTTTIVSVNGRYRYKNHVKWKKLPYWQTLDIISIGIEDNKVYGVSSTKRFSAYYDNGKSCYYFGDSNTWTLSSQGYIVEFNYPVEPQNFVSGTTIEVDMYFEVEKNTKDKISVLNAYGDYKHLQGDATNTSYSISFDMGGGISVSNGIASKFDSINTAQATLTGINW